MCGKISSTKTTGVQFLFAKIYKTNKFIGMFIKDQLWLDLHLVKCNDNISLDIEILACLIPQPLYIFRLETSFRCEKVPIVSQGFFTLEYQNARISQFLICCWWFGMDWKAKLDDVWVVSSSKLWWCKHFLLLLPENSHMWGDLITTISKYCQNIFFQSLIYRDAVLCNLFFQLRDTTLKLLADNSLSLHCSNQPFLTRFRQRCFIL